MKVYIVRHGEVSFNVLKCYSTIDEDLTDVGVIQARNLRQKIKDIKYDIIISSPLVRAKHTADIINFNRKEIVTDERIKERDCGDLSGKPLNAIDRDEYWNYNTSIKYGTSEDIQLFFRRIYSFLDELRTKEYSSVLIVAHSGVSKVFSAYFEGINEGMFLDRGLKNCEIKEYNLKK